MSDPLVRATVGPGGDFDLQSQDAGDWAQPVWRALTGSSPKRWLVFTGSAYHFHSPVNLNNVPGSHYLRLEGGGIGVTRIIRSFDGAAGTPSSGIFFSSEWDSSGTADHWQLFFTGIEFDGNRNSHVGNCCNFGPLDFCYFENCGFNNANVVFQATESCMFENNLLVNSSFSDNGINTVCAFNYPNTAC
jgi:hypothetical protein